MLRHDWQLQEVLDLFNLPLMDLVYKSHEIHRQNFNPNKIQLSSLCSIKTGACPEDCKYCSQSRYHNSNLKKEPLMDTEEILKNALEAKKNGSSRFCMGAAWRRLKDADLPKICEVISKVKDLGMETCVTLGSVTESQAKAMKEAGLDYYNHNIDTSKEYYKEIITTRTFDERLETLENVRNAGINVCCGGIVGMGEKPQDRADMLVTLANLPEHPQSVPINMLVPIAGTPLGNTPKLDDFEFIKTIAVARILMPRSFIRLSAGRLNMNEQTQFLCFFCGANSIFSGEKLLTTENVELGHDAKLFGKLQLTIE